MTLSRVDPDILASHVLEIDDTTGFGLVPERIKKPLRHAIGGGYAERSHVAVFESSRFAQC